MLANLMHHCTPACACSYNTICAPVTNADAPVRARSFRDLAGLGAPWDGQSVLQRWLAYCVNNACVCVCIVRACVCMLRVCARLLDGKRGLGWVVLENRGYPSVTVSSTK